MKHIYQYQLRAESAERFTELLRHLHMDFQLHDLQRMDRAPRDSVVVVDDATTARHDGVFIYFGFSSHHDADCHLDPLEGKTALLEKLRTLFEGHYRSTTLIGLLNTGEVDYYRHLYRYLASFDKRVLLVDLAYRSTAGTVPNFSKILYCCSLTLIFYTQHQNIYTLTKYIYTPTTHQHPIPSFPTAQILS